MISAQRKALVAGLGGVAVAVAAYWWFSPYVSLNSIRSAVEAKDAARVNDHVDYPKLRESLKGQLVAHATGKMTSGGSPGEALGAGMAMMMIPAMVESMVRPEVVTKLMSEPVAKAAPGQPEPKTAAEEFSSADWQIKRETADRIVLMPKPRPDAPKKALGDLEGVVLEREGFATWKVTGLRMPAK